MKYFYTFIFLSFFIQLSAQNWQTISTDPSGDSNGLDGTTLEYQYDAVLDKVMFRITTTNLSNYSTGPAADFSFQLPNGLESGNAAGAHWTSSTPVHKTAYIYCDAGGSAPNNYTFNTWSQRIEETSSQNVLCSNCVGINADVASNQITYTFNRTDIITDMEMGGNNSATITLVHNVGHDVMWDDNVTETGTFTITLSNVSLNEGRSLNNLSLYPNPSSENITISGILKETSYSISDRSGKVVGFGMVSPDETLDISTLSSGIYFIKVGGEVLSFSKK